MLLSKALASMALAGVLPAVGQEPPLLCFGNEPSWSVDLTEPGAARLTLPGEEPVVHRGSDTRNEPLRERVWRGSPAGGGGDLVVFLSSLSCRDGMSDVRHPVTARVSLHDGRFLVGCCREKSNGAAGAAPTAATLEGVSWRIVDIPGQDPAVIAAASKAVTVRFQGGRVTGFSGCNQFMGSYRIEGDRVIVGQLAGTMKACPSMELENAFRKALMGSVRYTIDGGRLTLDANGPTAVFEADSPELALGGTAWEVTGVNNGRGGVASTVAGTTLTLSFENAAVAGSGGCNTFRGSYTQDGESLAIDRIATTRKMCTGSLIMEQERAFLAALEGAKRWTLRADQLDLHGADGTLALTARKRTG